MIDRQTDRDLHKYRANEGKKGQGEKKVERQIDKQTVRGRKARQTHRQDETILHKDKKIKKSRSERVKRRERDG